MTNATRRIGLAVAVLTTLGWGVGRARAGLVLASGYESRVVATGGILAGKNMDGVAVDQAGNTYVAQDTINGQGQSGVSFDLRKITPQGVVTTLGSYGINHFENARLTIGPDGNVYTADTWGNVFAINATTGQETLYSSTGLSLGRYGLNFRSDGSLILMPEGGFDQFYKVNPGGGATYLGSYFSPQGNHGDDFSIVANGDFVIHPDGFSQVIRLATNGHVDGMNYATSLMSSTIIQNSSANGGLDVAYGHSIGAADGITGDVYSSGENFGLGDSRIALTPGNGDASTPSTLLVSGIGNGLINGASRGVTALTTGVRSDGLAGNSLYFTDTYSNTVYEVRKIEQAATPEPSTLVSGTIAGLMGLGYAWRRRKAKAAA